MSYLYLIGAIVFEVVGTMLLPLSKNFTKPFISIILIASYVLSFYFLTYALKDIPIAVVYSTWAGVGIFLITFLGYIFYSQSLQWQSIVGLIFIAIGVAIVNIFKG
tara:strand:+ start:76 stop:393 length:318 start_codon:yes stop_codon:yes gene_type:complete